VFHGARGIETQAKLATTLAGLDRPTIAVGLAIALALLDLVLLAAATTRFRRARLILD
jgi:hypothetical protein